MYTGNGRVYIQSSGKHGVLLFSQGSVFKNLKDEKASFIASALAQIPQKISILTYPAEQFCSNSGENRASHTPFWDQLNSLCTEHNWCKL